MPAMSTKPADKEMVLPDTFTPKVEVAREVKAEAQAKPLVALELATKNWFSVPVACRIKLVPLPMTRLPLVTDKPEISTNLGVNPRASPFKIMPAVEVAKLVLLEISTAPVKVPVKVRLPSM